MKSLENKILTKQEKLALIKRLEIYEQSATREFSLKSYIKKLKKECSPPKKRKPCSPETKLKLSLRMRGNLNPAKRIEVRKKLSVAGKGRIMSEEAREKNSRAKSGKNHPGWKGGKSREPYSHEFNNRLKYQIRERDNFTCNICYKIETDKKFCVHHIDYNKKNNHPSNLITLCRKCHPLTCFDRHKWTPYLSFICRLKSTIGTQPHLLLTPYNVSQIC